RQGWKIASSRARDRAAQRSARSGQRRAFGAARARKASAVCAARGEAASRLAGSRRSGALSQYLDSRTAYVRCEDEWPEDLFVPELWPAALFSLECGSSTPSE